MKRLELGVVDDYRHVNVSMESFKFAKNFMMGEVTDLFRGTHGKTVSDVQESNFNLELADIVFKFTGIRLKFVLDNYGPAIQPPNVDRNNVLINNMHRDFYNSRDTLDIIAKAKTLVSGEVNMITGKVSGVFSEYVSLCYMPIKEIIGAGKLSPEELASTLFHEIGHVWTLFYTIANTARTNMALAAIERDYRNERSIERRRIILKRVGEALDVKDVDTDALAETESAEVVQIVFITNVRKKERAQMGEAAGYYDEVNYEYMSDSYARAQGAGPYLSSALDKLYPSWHISKRGPVMWFLVEVLKWASLTTVPSLLMIMMTLDSYPSMYDEPGYRLKRIRDQLVNDAKDRNVPKELSEKILEDIKVLDANIKEFNDYHQLHEILLTQIIPSLRRAKNQRELQRSLETLLNNDLFVRSHELKILGGK